MKAKILLNEQQTHRAWRMIVSASQIAKVAKPGQFVMARCADSCQPLLRRPLGVYYVRGGNIELLYEIIGEGTMLLAQKRAGEYLDLIGPLGNGFYVGHSTTNILIAGGMGTAPLLFLAQRLINRKPIVLIGAKTKDEILCEKEFKALGCDVRVATDNGSKGHEGFVTDLLKNLLSAKRYPLNAIYACGPHPMLQEVAAISQRYKIPAQVSLEAHMACGIGACLGCVVNTKDGYKRVCKEGPVFDAQDIIWQEEICSRHYT